MRSLMRVESRSGGVRSNLRGTGTSYARGRSGGVERASGLSGGWARRCKGTSFALQYRPPEALYEGVEREAALIALRVTTHPDLAGLDLTVPDDQHVVRLAQLGLADL